MTQGPLTSLPIQHTLALCGFQNQGPSRGWGEAQNPHLMVSRPKLVAREVSPLKVLKKKLKKRAWRDCTNPYRQFSLQVAGW